MPKCTHACHKETSRQRVLQSFSEPCRLLHIFPNILDRLPHWLQDQLACELDPDSSLADRHMGVASTRACLQSFYPQSNEAAVASPCCLHGGTEATCPVNAKVYPQPDVIACDDSDDEHDHISFVGAGVV